MYILFLTLVCTKKLRGLFFIYMFTMLHIFHMLVRILHILWYDFSPYLFPRSECCQQCYACICERYTVNVECLKCLPGDLPKLWPAHSYSESARRGTFIPLDVVKNLDHRLYVISMKIYWFCYSSIVVGASKIVLLLVSILMNFLFIYFRLQELL